MMLVDCGVLWILRVEGVAGGHTATLKSRFEPVGALFRASMGEGFRNNITPRLRLQTVVADHGRSAERFIDITRI